MGVTAEWVRLKEVKDSRSPGQKLSHILEMKEYTVMGVVRKCSPEKQKELRAQAVVKGREQLYELLTALSRKQRVQLELGQHVIVMPKVWTPKGHQDTRSDAKADLNSGLLSILYSSGVRETLSSNSADIY